MGTVITGPNPAFAAQFDRQQPDLVGNLSHLLALKQQQALAPLQQQEAQQRVQQGQLDLQKSQQEKQDSDAFRLALQDPSLQGQTYGKIADALASKGAISPAAYQAAKKADIEARKEAMGMETTTLDNAAKATVANKQLLESVLSLPEEQIAQNWPQIVEQYNQIPGNAKRPLNPNQPLTKDQIQMQGPMIGIHQAYVDDELKRREAKDTATKTAADAAKAQYEAAQMAQNGGLTATQKETADYHKQEIAVRNRQLGIEGARLNFEKSKNSLDQSQSALTGDDFLKTLPGGTQAQVKAMANGDIAVPSASARNPQAQQLRTAVLTYDPTYTDARYKGKQNFKTSGDAQNIVQLSTAMEHADRAISNSAKAGFAPALGNRTLESPTSAAYMQDAEFLTGEVGKLVKNGVLTVDEGNKISSGLTSARQGVRESALNETMDLLGGKARGVFQKYKTATGQDLPVSEFFDSKSQQRLSKYGIVEGPQAQSGSAPSFSMTATGPNNHKIGSNDNGKTWFDVQTGKPVQ